MARQQLPPALEDTLFNGFVAEITDALSMFMMDKFAHDKFAHVYELMPENLSHQIEHHIGDLFNQYIMYMENLDDTYASDRDLVYQLYLDENDCLGDEPQDKLNADGIDELYELQTHF